MRYLTGVALLLALGFAFIWKEEPLLHAQDAGEDAASSDADAETQEPKPAKARYVLTDELFRLYKNFGLPVVPEGAQMVQFDSGRESWINEVKQPQTYRLAFVLRPKTQEASAKYLVGTWEYGDYFIDRDAVPADPGKLDPSRIEHASSWLRFDENSGLATAFHCKALGYDELANGLLTECCRSIPGYNWHWSGEEWPPNTPVAALASLAWAHHLNKLVQPLSDRREILRKMNALAVIEPALFKRSSELLESLEAALVPSRAKPDSIEAAIDDLVNYNTADSVIDISRYDSNPQWDRVLLFGFSAVPLLIDHMEDERLTRAVELGFMNAQTRILKVGEVVHALLQTLAGHENNPRWRFADKSEALAWWEKARAIGEEAYLVEHALDPGEYNPNNEVIKLIAAKYPSRLGEIYRRMLDEDPSLQAFQFTETIAKSSLDKSEKLELLELGAKHRELKQRYYAINALNMVDKDVFMKHLLPTMESLPTEVTEELWTHTVPSFSNIVMETDDQRAWDMLLKVTKRSDVGLRLEFMSPMDYIYIEDRQRAQRIAYLAAFLDDDEVRVIPEAEGRYSGPCAAFTFPKISVRDYAAMTLANIFEFKDDPDENWSEEQWAALRTKVKAAVKEE